MTASPARSIARAKVESPAIFRAPLFRSVIEQLDKDRRCVVLDLGAACARTVALLGEYRCHLDIADLTGGLEQLNAETDRDQLRRRAELLLPPHRAEATDVVLCWDMLNYLSRAAIMALMSQVAGRAHPGTLVHMLIAYSSTHMPARPSYYVPQADYSLLHVPVCQDQQKAPRYSPEDLKYCLPGYGFQRAMLLSNGMQEFLYSL